jgi:hypothetical protein
MKMKGTPLRQLLVRWIYDDKDSKYQRFVLIYEMLSNLLEGFSEFEYLKPRT